MKWFLNIILFLLALVVLGVVWLYLRSDLEPRAWEVAPQAQLTGVFAPNQHLRPLRVTLFGDGAGPEDIARGPDGFLYTGLEDGRVMRFKEQGKPVEMFNTGGRPLGLQFDRNGNLIIADGVKGLLHWTPAGTLSTLTDAVDGVRMRLVDDLDIGSDGTIWFTDASMRFGYYEYTKDFLEGSATGRLLSFTPATGQTHVHMSGLFFANGVALGPNEEYVVISETGTGRLHRLWLQGEKKGTQDYFYDGLPGNPDNLSFNGTDTFWVALPVVRNADTEKLAASPFIRKLIGGLRLQTLPAQDPAGFVVGINIDGSISHVLLEQSARYYSVTSVHQWGNKLYLGSIAMHGVGVVPVPPAVQ